MERGDKEEFIMKKRMFAALLVMAVLVAGLGFVKFQQIRAAMAQTWSPPPEAVTTIAAQQEQWPSTASVIGTVTAVQGVTVSADLPGIVQEIHFESGRKVSAGDVLVKLDVSQERAQLAAADAQRDLARLNLDRMGQLREKQVVSQAELDQATAEFKQADARAGEIRAVIDRKQIRAPFTGVLGIRQINLGQYLTAGDPVVPLQSLDPVYVNFSVPQQELGELKIGATVKVAAESVAVVAAGKVTAINSVVDEATRNVQIQAVLRNPSGTLRPGMFVEVEARLGNGAPVIALPATSVSYAPYGNSVFVVTDLKGPNGKPYLGVEQRFVKLGGNRGDQVAVVSGLKTGEVVVTSGVFKLRSGASVQVHNEIRPGNNPAPKPEDS
jgi:membrane fusion protein (multidrug efflux system)